MNLVFDKFSITIWSIIWLFGVSIIGIGNHLDFNQPIFLAIMGGVLDMTTMSLCVLLNNYLLLPIFFKKSLLLFVYVPLFLVLGWLLGASTHFLYSIVGLTEFREIIKDGSQSGVAKLITNCISIFCISSLFVIKNAMAYKNQLQELEKEKKTAELNALRVSVNPHFLFNSLNGLYALSLDKSDMTPYYITKLSDVLRYVIYQNSKEYVMLDREISFIADYIELQKIRLKDNVDITFEVIGTAYHIEIIPVVFIFFIENAFKHGMRDSTNKNFIHISIQATNTSILFICENNLGVHDIIKNDENSGFGLSNVKNRLNLIYPNRHKLEIQETDKSYHVSLKLEI